MAEYKTFNGLVISWQGGLTHRVTIKGAKEKVLYEGDNMGEAKAAYDEAKAHYEARKKDEEAEFVNRHAEG